MNKTEKKSNRDKSSRKSFQYSAEDEVTLQRLAEFFKVFGDFTRIRILRALSSGEVCVQDIAETLGMNQSAISHQLRILKQARLVKFRRQGKTIFYSLDDDHVRQVLDQGLEHIHEETHIMR